MHRLSGCLTIVLFLCAAAGTSAQTARDAKVSVTVADPSGAVVPGATVTVTGLDDATKTIDVAPVSASEKGIAVLDGLAPGRYTIQARFSGFDDGVLKDVRIRSGENKHVVVLGLKAIQDTVSVVQ